MIKNEESPFKIIIISDERSTPASGKELIPCDLKPVLDSLVNVSVVAAFKKGKFSFDGFASYCSAKNDLTEEIKKRRKVTVNAYMLIYSYNKNAFDVIVSDVNAHISVSYRELLPKVQSNMTSFIDPLFAKTPISKGLIDESIIEGKLSCQKTITIMIVHYIEEILRNLNAN